MSNDTKSAATETEEQKITPQSAELNDEQLDDTSGGGTGTVGWVPPPPRTGPIGP